MNGTRFNPLDMDALTSDNVEVGDRIICWRPGVSESTRRFTFINGPYNDDEDSMVVDVMFEGETEPRTVLTSEVGLTGQRYDGTWTHIARYDENTGD